MRYSIYPGTEEYSKKKNVFRKANIVCGFSLRKNTNSLEENRTCSRGVRSYTHKILKKWYLSRFVPQ